MHPARYTEEEELIMIQFHAQQHYGYGSGRDMIEKVEAIEKKYGLHFTQQKEYKWPIKGVLAYNHTANYKIYYK